MPAPAAPRSKKAIRGYLLGLIGFYLDLTVLRTSNGVGEPLVRLGERVRSPRGSGEAVELVKRHWTQDGKLVPEYEPEKALQLIKEAIDPLAGAALGHGDDVDELELKLKLGQDQMVELLL